MAEKEKTYLETQTETAITYDENVFHMTFHRAKIKMQDEREIHMLKTVQPRFKKSFTLTEDQLEIQIEVPPSYLWFHSLQEKREQVKWRTAYNLIGQIKGHTNPRLHLLVCPENIVIDHGLVPHFLHYGVKESIPPYEDDEMRLWNETKATIAMMVDDTHEFTTYLSQDHTVKMAHETKEIIEANTYETLQEIVERNLQKQEAAEKLAIRVPTKKWKTQRYAIMALIICLLPALGYTVYASIFKLPETNAYVESNNYFLEQEYSSVIDTLDKYNEENMPYVVQYQLANAYIQTESLTEEQRKNVQNTITLQSNENYFLYWIDIGRGNVEKAIDRARLLEDRDLIIYSLLKQRELVKTDQSIEGEERKQQLSQIEQEIKEYTDEMEEEMNHSETEEVMTEEPIEDSDDIEDQEETKEKDAEGKDSKKEKSKKKSDEKE